MKKLQITITFVLLFLLMSCSSPEYKAALTQYQLAKSTQNIQQLAQALTTLASLDPEKYQAEYLQAKKVQTKLEQAKAAQARGDNHAAYLSSHASYRSIPNTAAKQILISSGKTLFPLLQAKLSLDKSFSYRPKKLSTLFETYSWLPVGKWDLIKVNSTVEQLSRSVKELKKAHKLLQKNTSTVQTALWQRAIENQLTLLTKTRDYFSNLARYHGAKVLKMLNNDLSNESIKLLSLVRPKLAQESMQPSFLKAQNEYVLFHALIENLSLAANLSTKDLHIDWYQHWQSIEVTTLKPEGDFENYPLNSTHRNKQLNAFLDTRKINLPKLGEEFHNKSAFYQAFPNIIALTKKLKMDKALLI